MYNELIKEAYDMCVDSKMCYDFFITQKQNGGPHAHLFL